MDDSSRSPLSPSSAMADDASSGSLEEVDLGDEIELPLEEAMAVAGDESISGVSRSSESEAKSPRGRAKTGEGNRRKRRRRRTDSAGESKATDSAGQDRGLPAVGLLSLGAEQLRHMIGEQPDLIEPGLRVLGEEGRRQLGVVGGAELGDLDLLARSDSGDWVVVMVAEGSPQPAVVSDVLRCVGWVRKHLCEAEDTARAIVLVEGMNEELGYAASAVGDAISFRTWRVSVAFDPVEV